MAMSIVVRLRSCWAIHCASASAVVVVRLSTRTLSVSPEIGVEAIGSKDGRPEPTHPLGVHRLSGAVRTFTSRFGDLL
jgi:hypothetical protein